MPAVELGRGPKDGSNSTDASTDISSSDVTRTLGAFSTGAGIAISGESAQADGTWGTAHASGKSGVVGFHTADGNGVFGHSVGGDGTWGVADAKGRSGIVGIHTGAGNAIFGRAAAPGNAGYFDGTVVVTGDIQFLNADYAEDFDLSDQQGAEPGSVMVLDDGASLRESHLPYDGRVAGVVCGAGTFRPAVILDRRNDTTEPRVTVALVGKVYCKVDASSGPVRPGDLLTTSATPGHAMRATDRDLAFGAILGKALAGLDDGKALIPILVALQ